MSFEEYETWRGRVVYFYKKHRAGRQLLKWGVDCGVIVGVSRDAASKIIYFEVVYGPPEKRRTVRLTRRAFTTNPPNGKRNYRPLIGMTVFFNPADIGGQHLIEQGMEEGVVSNVTAANGQRIGENVIYEICFGPAGNKRFAFLGRNAFTFSKIKIPEQPENAGPATIS